MQVGSFGTIVFQCSSKEIMTFKDFNRNRSAEFVEHAVLENKSKLQFVGVSLEEQTFAVQLDEKFTDPEKRSQEFWAAQESGEPRNMILGNRNYGKFVIVSLSETQKHFRKGKASFIELELSLKEYN